MPTSPFGALATALAFVPLALAFGGQVGLTVVAISENNATLLGVAMIGAVGSVSAAVIAAGTRQRVEQLERKSEEAE